MMCLRRNVLCSYRFTRLGRMACSGCANDDRRKSTLNSDDNSLLKLPIPKAMERCTLSVKERFDTHIPPQNISNTYAGDLIPREVLAKACRILCTDNFTLFENLRRRIPDTVLESHLSFANDVEKKAAISKLFSSQRYTLDTDQPVTISWLPMDPAHKNMVTVDDALQQLTHLPSPNLHLDVLRNYLMYSFGLRPSDPFYWLEKILVETSVEIHPILTSLINLYKTNGPFQSSGDGSGPGGIYLSMCQMNDRVVASLQVFFNLRRAHSDYIRFIKYMLEKVDSNSELTSVPGFSDILRDLCIITHVFYPQTAEQCWKYLYPETSECLESQKWPLSPENTVHPFTVCVWDSKGRLLQIIRSQRQKKHLELITREGLLESIRKTKRYRSLFGNDQQPEVVDLTWKVHDSPLKLSAHLTLNVSDELTEMARERQFDG